MIGCRFVPLGVLSLLFTAAASAPLAQEPTATRTVLLRHAITVPGYEVVMVRGDIPVGGREGRHTHPGVLVGHVEEGTVTLDDEGKPSVVYKAGDTFFVEAGKVHEGINTGNVPVKVLAVFVVKTGAPLTTPAK